MKTERSSVTNERPACARRWSGALVGFPSKTISPVQVRQVARERQQRRRLAGAVRAEQDDDLALRGTTRSRSWTIGWPWYPAETPLATRSSRSCRRLLERPAQRLRRLRASPCSSSSPRRGRPRSTAGLARISAGVPVAICLPKSSTVIRSQTLITNDMSCSITSMPRPHSCASRRTTVPSSVVSVALSPAAGSSRRRIDGETAIARAIATRRRRP